jgi:hypothetical protein
MELSIPATTRVDLPDPVGMPVEAPYKFGLGFAVGFVEGNNLTAIEDCYHSDASSFKYVK